MYQSPSPQQGNDREPLQRHHRKSLACQMRPEIQPWLKPCNTISSAAKWNCMGCAKLVVATLLPFVLELVFVFQPVFVFNAPVCSITVLTLLGRRDTFSISMPSLYQVSI
mmetsp:Transcript_30589/g.55763  ORF Transcript_30589/g.55763 Transcript_30589/m.55763 type:complete len:110 (+) Transcript_30589:35-364(+)